MGFVDKAAAAVETVAAAMADSAKANGQYIYVHTLPKPSAFAAGMDPWGIAIQAIESRGWKLETLAITSRDEGRAVFRLVLG